MTKHYYSPSYTEERDLTVEDWVGDIVNELPRTVFKKKRKDVQKSHEE